METVFTNCGIDIIDIPTPPGQPAVQAIIIVDNVTRHQYTFPMDENLARHVGGRLMGLGKVEIAGAGALGDLKRQNGKGGKG